jgi:alpha-ketoglutaric semialdehyde dehydrogenase
MAQPVLTARGWEPKFAIRTFRSVNPNDGHDFGPEHPVSGLDTILAMSDAAAEAAPMLNRCPPEQVAEVLRDLADRLDADRARIAVIADLETALGIHPRLEETEMDRTVGQLRQAAAAVGDRWWRMAAIEPDLNVRSMMEPLGGAVLVIGPANFPLAYNGCCGGDFTAALASGNPVIAKGHPSHPQTSGLLAEHTRAAYEHAGLPPGSFQFFYDCEPNDGLSLVRHPGITAVGFTGSKRAGLSIKAAADELGKPTSLEMSSVNPIFILPGCLESDRTAHEIADSMLAAAGQQCTSPGLLFVAEHQETPGFVRALQARLESVEPQPLLSRSGVEHLEKSIETLTKAGAEVIMGGKRVGGPGFRFEHTLLKVSAEQFQSDPRTFQTEGFGVFALVVVGAAETFVGLAGMLEGSLTGSVYAGDSDASLSRALCRALRSRVGRLLNNAVPTGVAVRPAMVHGGPFPATGHPGFTAVGIPLSMHRFCARRCYDRVRPEHLPPELRNRNPTGRMLRLINGVWTPASIPE